MRAGEGFRFECDFENSNAYSLRYGIKGTDEMCILAGWIWPAGDANELPLQDCGVTWIDGEGIGHPASESGGFPPASAQDANLCLTGIKLLGLAANDTNGCSGCICNSCATTLLSCAQDPDCGALISCLGQPCGSESECIQACEAELHDQSSAIGMLGSKSVAAFESRCEGCGFWGG